VASAPDALLTGAPTGVRFIDYDGVVFDGSYALDDGKLVLTLSGSAPIEGAENTNGIKYMTVHLERPKPRKPGFQPFARPY
jgi:hypothetical protein